MRRTSTIDMLWPEGIFRTLELRGRARDILTPLTGAVPVVTAEANLYVRMSGDRTIERITAQPSRSGTELLVGAKAGGGLRAATAAAFPEDRTLGTPLALLADDIAGASLIAPFALSQHGMSMGPGQPPDLPPGVEPPRRRVLSEPVCAGLRPGASSAPKDGSPGRRQNVARVPSLIDPDDPLGWHVLPELPLLGMRRSRRIDVWREGVTILVDTMFRDLVHDPDGREVAVHEYAIEVTIDSVSRTLIDVVAEPRVLPFPECPAAAPNARWLIGVSVADLRSEVISRIRGADCCTHLNDALRALADVPALLTHIPAQV